MGSRWAEASLANLMPNDITTWVVVPLVMLIAGMLAGAAPAWRASRVDPNVVLREL